AAELLLALDRALDGVRDLLPGGVEACKPLGVLESCLGLGEPCLERCRLLLLATLPAQANLPPPHPGAKLLEPSIAAAHARERAGALDAADGGHDLPVREVFVEPGEQLLVERRSALRFERSPCAREVELYAAAREIGSVEPFTR